MTHFEDDVYALADYVAALQKGLIEYNDKIESILSSQTEHQYPFVSTMFDKANYVEGKVIDSSSGILHSL